MNKILQIFSVISLLFLSINTATAWTVSKEQKDISHLEINIDKGRELFRTCAVCHAPTGWGTPDGRYPQIAGQHQEVVIKQLLDIRSGNRDNPTMYPFTTRKVLKTEQQIADISAYIEALPMNTHNETGPGIDIEYGKKLYQDHCADCHGESGEGDAHSTYPRVHGQHYHYLVRQLLWIQNGRRRNANDDMLKRIHDYGMREITSLSDYISRLPVPDKLKAKTDWVNPDFSINFRSRTSQ